MWRFQDSKEVSYAVRLPVVVKYLGQLCLAASVLTCVPGLFALADVGYRKAAAYLVVIVVAAVFGVLASRLPAPRDVQRNEAVVVATLIFPIAAALMTGPYMSCGLSFRQSFFEAMSGVTTTGLTTVASVEALPRSFQFARAWQQWYGGLGIVVLSLALSAHPRSVMRRAGEDHSGEGDMLGGTLAHARRTLLVYAVMTAAGFLLLWGVGLGWFDALAQTLAAVSTGGFATHDTSLAKFASPWPQAATIGICTLCAVSLPAYWRASRHGWRTLILDLQFIGLLALGVLVSGLLIAFAHGDASALPTTDAVLTAFSAQTTAGFSTVPISELDSASKLVLICAMAVGGSTESTAGGIKVLRLIVVFRLIQTVLARTAIPRHAVVEPRLGRHRLGDEELQAALLVNLLFGIVILASWIPFVAQGYAPVDALFEVVSATGTVGLSTGICSPDLPAGLQAVLCLDMLLGRLEIIALLVVLFPRTWFGKRVQTA